MKNFSNVLDRCELSKEKMRIYHRSLKVSGVIFGICELLQLLTIGGINNFSLTLPVLFYTAFFSTLITITSYSFCFFVYYGPRRKQIKEAEEKLRHPLSM